MVTEIRDARRLSASVFGNEKVVEVVLALEEIRGAATAQELANRTGISHSMVRDVLVRLAAAGLVEALPRVGGTRSPQYYEPDQSEAWGFLLGLVRWIAVHAHQLNSTGSTPPAG